MEEGTVQVRFKKFRRSNKKAKMGAFPLLYPYREEKFGILVFQETRGAGSSSNVNGDMVKVRKTTWEDH